MVLKNTSRLCKEQHIIQSTHLNRDVIIDCYSSYSRKKTEEIPLLFINDGQDLPVMNFDTMLADLFLNNEIEQIFCVGIHCAVDRKNEYGTATMLDYKGRGAKAFAYNFFIFEELMPYLLLKYTQFKFTEKSFAGFSLGGLCALDITWQHRGSFKRTGIFSGSLWWRDKSLDDVSYDENENRIMHKLIRKGAYQEQLSFFFQAGGKDEYADRNNNGIIDSIDDTISLIAELALKGYNENQIQFLEIPDGAHDVATWGKAMPAFLKWGWGKMRPKI